MGGIAPRILLCCMVALASGCSSEKIAPASRPTTKTTTPGPAATDDRSQVIEAYLAMWRTYVEAARTSDYQSPDLAMFAAGEAHSTLTYGLHTNHKNGQVSRGAPVFRPEVVELVSTARPAKASVRDCADDSAWRLYDRAGRPVGAKAKGKRRVDAELRLFGSAWKVTRLVVQKEGTC